LNFEEEENKKMNRRVFLQSAAVTLAMANCTSNQRSNVKQSSAPTSQGYPLIIPGYYGSKPGIQVGTQMKSLATDEDMQFVRQLGVEWVMTSLSVKEQTLENYLALKRRFEKHGLKIYRVANHSVHNMDQVTLNLPGRDEKVEEYLTYIRLLGKAGIRYATYAHMANGIWSSEKELIRGEAVSRALRLDKSKGYWNGKVYSPPLSHGRRYSEEELWDNYEYFIRKVVPVAEEAGVYIGIHPDDPPVYELGGVPRCIFGNFNGYKRALEMADSPNIGVCLCVGCWLEGGEQMGKNVLDTIRYFAGQNKLFKVHFRNVTKPLPEGFKETFLDEGYMNMYEVVRALYETVGGRRTAEAFSVGYMKALIQAAIT
jgi:mannonate dehydratase